MLLTLVEVVKVEGAEVRVGGGAAAAAGAALVLRRSLALLARRVLEVVTAVQVRLHFVQLLLCMACTCS